MTSRTISASAASTRRCWGLAIGSSTRCSCRLSGVDLARCRHALEKLIHHREDQVLFVDLGPAEGRGERVVSALGRAYSHIDSPCIVVDREPEPGPLAGTRRSIEARQRARRQLTTQEDEHE